MSLVMLRDAVNASEWDSPAAMQEWIGRVTGKNRKWLDAAWQAALQAVREDPLEGPAYLHLARLSFLKDPTGDLQRRLIERAFKVRPHDPDILILDESTSGLDPNQLVGIRRLIRELGQSKTVLLSTHVLQEVEVLCTRVILIHEGRIVYDGSMEAMGDRNQMEQQFHQLTGFSV